MERIWFKSYDRGVPRTANYPDMPLYQFLDEAACNYPENIATIFVGQKMTYRELARLVGRFAAALSHLGVKKGDRVALLLPNCPQYVIAFYGVLKAGAIVVPTNPLYTERELSYRLNDSGAQTIVTLNLRMLYPKVIKVRKETKLKNIIISSLKEYLPFPKNILYSLLRKKEIAKVKEGEKVYWLKDLLIKEYGQPPKVGVNPEEIAVLEHTGGTTGTRKAPCLTHRNLVANAVQCRSLLPDVRIGAEIFLAVLPLFFHATSLNLPVYIKSTMILVPRFDIEEMLKLIHRYKPTLFMGVPPIYRAITQYSKLSRYDLSSLRFSISGAAPLPLEIEQEFEKLTGCKLVEGYGLTEASPVTHCNPFYGRRRGIGLPLPNTDCKIVDLETGEKELSPDTEGELCIKGPQIMAGYWNRLQETESALKNGWLYTGDIAKMDAEGYFQILDRKKDMIIVQKTEFPGGFHVYPYEIEEILLEHPKVLDAGVIGIPDPVQGERVKAFVVLKQDEDATSEELIEFCKRNLVDYKVPAQIEFRKELPKSLVGKVLRRKLRDEELEKGDT